MKTNSLNNSSSWTPKEVSTLRLDADDWFETLEENDEQIEDREISEGFFCCTTCLKCCIIGALISGIALAVILALWLTASTRVPVSTTREITISGTSGIVSNNITTSTSTTSTATTSTSSSTTSSTSTSTKTTSTSTRTTSTSTSTTSTSSSTTSSTTTSTSTTITTTSTSTKTTTSTTTSTTTKESSGFCNGLHWNLTGLSIAGTSVSGAAAHQFNAPSYLFIDDNDTLYVCDANNGRVQRWLPNASSGTTISDGVLITNPEDVVVDKDGYVYVSDSSQHHVIRYPPGSTMGTVVAGRTNLPSAALTNLDSPTAMAITDNFTLYIIDAGNSRVVRWNPNATSGSLVINSGGIKLTSIALVSWSSNQLHLSSELDDCVYRWTLHASTSQVTLTQINASSTQMGDPWGIQTDFYGNLYVTDPTRRQVFIYCPNATVGNVATGGTGSTPALSKPYDVGLDSNLNLYVVDASKHQVFRYQRL